MEKVGTKVLLGDHDGRLTKGSHPDLVKYHYASQIERQKEIFGGVIRYNMAHVVMMNEQGVFIKEDAAKLLTGLKEIESLGVDGFPLSPEYQSVHPCMEAYLVKRYGYEVGGQILTGRARGDVQHTGGRLAVRDRFMEVLEEVIEVREVFLKQAERHTETIMPGYTWFQSAQPTTLAHDLLHLTEGFELNFTRLKNTFSLINLGPCEAGVGCGTGYPINRERVAELLGFEGLIENTKFAHREIGNGDIFLMADLALLMGHVFRITNDFYPMTSQEYGYFEFGDEWSSTSFIMPQKRNPAFLKSFRLKALRTTGDLTDCINTYYTSSSNMLGEIASIFEIPAAGMRENVIPALRQMKEIIPTLTVNKELAKERAGAVYTQATTIADALVMNKKLSFRTAHRIVGVLVRDAVRNKVKPSDITPDMLDKAAVEILGKPINLDPKILKDALDPIAIVRGRKGTGSTGPDMIKKAIENRRIRIKEDREWLMGKKAVLEEAERKLRGAVNSIIG